MTDPHLGAGRYYRADLTAVETYDQTLLSDEERRIKRATTLASAYITVTAQGGYGSLRRPLSRAHRVLYVATAGAQFEKYGKGPFTYQDGSTDANELECSEFIIKTGAAANPQPLFPSYYRNKTIPGYDEVPASQIAQLGDNDFIVPSK